MLIALLRLIGAQAVTAARPRSSVSIPTDPRWRLRHFPPPRRQKPGSECSGCAGVSGAGQPAAGACRVALSSQIVTGPSLISLTAICAPKRPVATGRPRPRKLAQKCPYSRSASSGRGGGREARPVALAQIREQRELAHHERPCRPPPGPSGSSCRPHPRRSAAPRPCREPVGRRLAIAGLDAEQHEQSAADRPDHPPLDLDARLADPLQQRLHGRRPHMNFRVSHDVRRLALGRARRHMSDCEQCGFSTIAANLSRQIACAPG